MVFDSWQYGDPMRVLEQKQQRAIKQSCGGCVHKKTMTFAVEAVSVCDLTNRLCGKRCRSFTKTKE
jgi:hypothetical protein